MKRAMPLLLGLLLTLSARTAWASPIVLEDLACMFENGRAVGRVLHRFEYGGLTEAEALSSLRSEVDAMALCFSPQPALDSSWVQLYSYWDDELYLPPFVEDDATGRLQLQGSSLSSEDTVKAIVSFWSAGVELGGAEVCCGLGKSAYGEEAQHEQLIWALEEAAYQLELGMEASPNLQMIEALSEGMLSLSHHLGSYEDPSFVTVSDYSEYIAQLADAIGSCLSAFHKIEASNPSVLGIELRDYYPPGSLEMEPYADTRGLFTISLPQGGLIYDSSDPEWESYAETEISFYWYARPGDPVSRVNIGMTDIGEIPSPNQQNQFINAVMAGLRQSEGVISVDLLSQRFKAGGIDYFPIDSLVLLSEEFEGEVESVETHNLLCLGFVDRYVVMANFMSYGQVDREMQDFAVALLSTLVVTPPAEPNT